MNRKIVAICIIVVFSILIISSVVILLYNKSINYIKNEYKKCLNKTIKLLETAIKNNDLKTDYLLTQIINEKNSVENKGPKSKKKKEKILKCLNDAIEIINIINDNHELEEKNNKQNILQEKLEEKKKELEIENIRIKNIYKIIIGLLITATVILGITLSIGSFIKFKRKQKLKLKKQEYAKKYSKRKK